MTIAHILDDMNKKSFLAIAFSASTALALTACGSDAETQPSTATAEATDTAASSAVASASETAASSAESSAAEEADETTATFTEAAQPAGEDPVFAAMDAVIAQRDGAVITSVDREDDSEIYEIDIVEGGTVVSLNVDAATGEVTEDDRDNDEDDVQKLANVSVAAHDAIQQALDQHPDGVLDEAELEEEGDIIEWQISLDDADRNDLADVKIQAS